MKREFKFRCWNENIAVPGSNEFMEYSDEIGLRKFFERYPINGIVMRGIAHRHIMQFTGLHDKNGQEIYEGDIVNCAMIFHGKPVKPYFKSKIVYNEFIGSWQISYLNINDEFVTDTIELKYELEVIGNIYENPELL